MKELQISLNQTQQQIQLQKSLENKLQNLSTSTKTSSVNHEDRLLLLKSEISSLNKETPENARQPMGESSISSWDLVLEQAIVKEKERQKQKQNPIPNLSDDCIYNILIKLSAESLQRARFVCKPWYNMIKSSSFMETHLHQFEKGLIFQSTSIRLDKPDTFCVELKLQGKHMHVLQRPDNIYAEKHYMYIMAFKDDEKCNVQSQNTYCTGEIMGSCNGLLLLENSLKPGGTIVMNPVTRELVPLPVGTLVHKVEESYGFGFNSSTGEYKVVHLFMDYLGFVSCEIITNSSRSWRAVNGPSFGLMGTFAIKPVSAIGALHWVPQADSDCIVSFGMKDDKFRVIQLPNDYKKWNGLIEMGESLSYFNHVSPFQIDMWILKGINGQKWIKIQCITWGSALDMFPVGYLRNSRRIVFSREEDESFYAYDFRTQRVNRLEIMNKCCSRRSSLDTFMYLPHVSSLVSWSKQKYQWEEAVE